MNKSILKKLPTLLAILVMAGGVQTFTSCSSDDEGDGGDPSSSSVGGGGGVSSSSGGGQGGGTPSSSSVRSSASVSSSSSAVQCLDADSGIFTDSRDNKEYKYVTICSQTWFAENLDYEVEGSKCYDNDPANCTNYGRLYDWSTAMALPSSCTKERCSSQIQSPHRGICPSGWHLPSDAEWTTLADYVGGSNTAGTKLKATSGWNNSGNGTDQYGFSALPSGFGSSGGSFHDVGNYGYWWSATESNANDAYLRNMNYGGSNVRRYSNFKSGLYPVRCLQD